MAERPSGLALVPLESELARRLHGAGIPLHIAEVIDLYACLAEMMRRRNLVYLALPAALVAIAEHPLYEQARYWGRGFYYDGLHALDETTNTLVRVPSRWLRSDILDLLQGYLFPDDLRLAAVVPLAWRVGLCVGWLSGLAVSQKDDAQAGLVMLSTLVAPLLSSSYRKEVSHGTKKARLNRATLLADRP